MSCNYRVAMSILPHHNLLRRSMTVQVRLARVLHTRTPAYFYARPSPIGEVPLTPAINSNGRSQNRAWQCCCARWSRFGVPLPTQLLHWNTRAMRGQPCTVHMYAYCVPSRTDCLPWQNRRRATILRPRPAKRGGSPGWGDYVSSVSKVRQCSFLGFPYREGPIRSVFFDPHTVFNRWNTKSLSWRYIELGPMQADTV